MVPFLDFYERKYYKFMLGLFRKKSEKSKLQEKYNALLKEAYDLSKISRLKSDMKMVEAGSVLKKIETLEKYDA